MCIVIYKAGEYSPEEAEQRQNMRQQVCQWVYRMKMLAKQYDSRCRKEKLLAEQRKNALRSGNSNKAHRKISTFVL